MREFIGNELEQLTLFLQSSLRCAALFVAIALVALVLDWFVRWMERIDVWAPLCRLFQFTALALATMDCVLVVCFAANIAVAEIREMDRSHVQAAQAVHDRTSNVSANR